MKVVFFALAQFMFNVGPNTLTFIMAAEIFPTVFRGTFYGISAASGKLGAIIIRAIVAGAGDGDRQLVVYLFVFSGIMLVLAVVAVLPGALPEVQRGIRKPAGPAASSRVSLEAGDGEESEHSAPGRRWWQKTLPRRWRSLALEDIARYPLPQDELALQRDETTEREDFYPEPGGLVAANGGAHEPDFSSFPSDFTNAAVMRVNVEDGTRKFEEEVTQRFSSPVTPEMSPSGRQGVQG